MNHTSGQYFDGKTSKPQDIELHLDETNAELRFGIYLNTTICWQLEDITFEHIGDSLEIRCNSNLPAHIKVVNDTFAEEFISVLKTKGHISWYQRIIRLEIKIHVAAAALILGIIIAGYLLVIPWVGEKAVLLIPVHYDISLGHTFYKQYVESNSIDSEKTKSLNLFAGKLQLLNTQKLHFTVINSPTVNAFSLPDGNIIVFTRLIDLMKDYDELAGLIGHEVSHVNNRHSMKMLCRNLSGYIFISAVLSDVNGIMAIIGDNVNNLQNLSYSRQFEREADEQGTRIMILNGINPVGMTDLFTRLQSSEKVVIPAFISSHPITSDRIVYINKLIKHSPHKYVSNPTLNELFHQLKN